MDVADGQFAALVAHVRGFDAVYYRVAQQLDGNFADHAVHRVAAGAFHAAVGKGGFFVVALGDVGNKHSVTAVIAARSRSRFAAFQNDGRIAADFRQQVFNGVVQADQFFQLHR